MDVVDESDHSPGPALSIKAIDNRSVHRICSGQVVLTLATAVKELVENSIDAGATSIEVRLKDYGAELIEVADNGVGVEEANFAGLTLKHHTSKLREFSDLTYVDTFGFRGEALSSLCALSNLCIMTCHKDTSVGTKLEFNNNGHITSQTPCARQRGTTVSLGQLFHSLPVRHKEFNRNLKKEFAKMLHVLNGYCIISTGIRISCTNQTATNGKKTVIVSTNGNDSLKENITNIFGPKQYQSLLKFTQGLPSEQVCTEYNIKVPETTLFRVEGFVSSSEHGKGRGSSDRQYIFVNRRPCDLAKVTRVVNEVYHSYNRHQFPFVMLNIVLAKESVDVNVTPDKRQIFICEEKLLLAIIKTSLIHLFEPISSVYQVNQGQGKLAASLTSSFAQKSAEGSPIPTILRKTASSPYSSPKVSLTSALSSLKRSFSSAFAKSDDYMASDESPIPAKLNRQRRLDNFFNIEQQSPTEDSLCGATLLQSPVLQGAKKESDVTPPITDIPASSDDMAYSDDISSSNADSTTSISNAIASTSDITSSNGYVTDSNGGITALSVDVTALSGDVTALSDDVTFSSGDIAASSGDVPASHGDITVCNSANRTSTDEVVVSHSDAASACSTELSTGVSSTTPEDTHRRSPNECLSLILTEQSSDKMPVDNDRTLGERLSPGEEESLREEEVQRSSVRDPGDEQEGEIEQSDSSESDRLLVSQHKVIEYDHAEDGVRLRSSRTVPFSMSQLQRSLSLRQKVVKETKDQFRSFRAQISPGDNQAAEEELKKEMKKYMFAKMEILGQVAHTNMEDGAMAILVVLEWLAQPLYNINVDLINNALPMFNLGFIIAKLGSDLFIVDQHATDEKYNFEMLQQHTVIHSQKLIQPQKLELTAANTIILIDNIDIFKTNGFEFEINEEASLTERIKLTAMPVSKNWTFGKDDIEELIFMLSDSPGVLCRPSRVRLMFASRACRKSIMVGTALNNAEMRKVLNHMGEIEQPWNCPHGRPTMRHLINLDCLQDLKK